MRLHHVARNPAPTRRRCANCSTEFQIDPRIGTRHRYCDDPQCRAAAKRASQRKWLSKPENTGYFNGTANALRSKLWRASNPHRKRSCQKRGKICGKSLNVALRACGAQDMNRRQLALLVGLASSLARTREQETIAQELRRLMVTGHAVLRSMDSSQDASADHA